MDGSRLKLDWNSSQVLGRGSYGVVYRGRFDGMAVAVKKIPLNRLDSNASRTESAMRGLDHRNVLKFLHQESDRLFRYWALELCAATLDDFCADKYSGPMPGHLQALIQMSNGVDYIHSTGLVHGDIKPRNVLISPVDQDSAVWLKLSDLGCCKRASMGVSFSVSGIRKTSNFLAPELLSASNSVPSPETDIFALGCTFYFLLTRGIHPFGNVARVDSNTLSGGYQLSALATGHFALGLIERMIQREPSLRPDSSAVVDQLEALAAPPGELPVKSPGGSLQEEPSSRPESPIALEQPEADDLEQLPLDQTYGVEEKVLTKASNRRRLSTFVEEIQFQDFDASPDPNKEPSGESGLPVHVHGDVRKLATASRIKSYARKCYGNATSGRVWHCKFHPMKQKLACAVDRGKVAIFVRLSSPLFLDWDKSHFIAQTESNFRRVAWNVRGTLIAAGSADGTVAVWNEEGRKCLEAQYGTSCINCLTWNKSLENGHLLVVANQEGTVGLWDSGDKVIRRTFQFIAPVRDLTWISHVNFAAAVSNGDVNICHVEFSGPVQTIHHQGFPHTLRWSAQDTLLACCFYDGFVKIWKPHRSETAVSLPRRAGSVYCMDWYNGRLGNKEISVVACGCSDSSILAWELDAQHKSPLVLRGNVNGIASVAFAPHGKALASVDSVGNLKIWSTKEWTVIFQSRLVSFHWRDCLSWSRDSRRLAVGNLSSQIRVVEFCKTISLLLDGSDESSDC